MMKDKKERKYNTRFLQFFRTTSKDNGLTPDVPHV